MMQPRAPGTTPFAGAKFKQPAFIRDNSVEVFCCVVAQPAGLISSKCALLMITCRYAPYCTSGPAATTLSPSGPGYSRLPLQGEAGAMRVRLSWTHTRRPERRLSADLLFQRRFAVAQHRWRSGENGALRRQIVSASEHAHV